MTDELAETLREIVARLESQGIPYMLVGSMAALAYGRDRSTKDLDVVLEAGPSALRALVRSLPEERFYASEDAAMEALRYESQFNVIDMVTGWKVDLIPRKRRAFSEAEFARRSQLEVMGVSTYVASVEDVIVASSSGRRPVDPSASSRTCASWCGWRARGSIARTSSSGCSAWICESSGTEPWARRAALDGRSAVILGRC